MAKWASFKKNNPDGEWRSYTMDVHFGGNSATVHVALSEINQWAEDVAAYAFIRSVHQVRGGNPYWEDPEQAPSVGWWGGIDYLTMELYLYGPITARATLLGVA